MNRFFPVCVAFVAALLLPVVACPILAEAAEVPFVELVGHTNTLPSAIFSPDGKKVVTASWDGTARIWDAESGKELHKFEGESLRAIPPKFSPDGKKVVTGGTGGTIRIWNVESGSTNFGRELQKLEGYTDMTFHAVFSPDGKKILSTGLSTASNDAARIWDVESGKELHQLEGHARGVFSAAFSPDGKKIVTTARDDTTRIWDTESGKELQQLVEPTRAVWYATFSPDGKKIATTSSIRTENTTAIGLVQIWDADSDSPNFGKALQALEGHTSAILATAFSPDGKKIVTASFDETARIWNVASGEELHRLQGNPNERRVLIVNRDFRGEGGTSLDLPQISFRFAAFSPDGKKILTGGNSHDFAARIWDVDTGKELQKLETTHHAGSTELTSASFSPDGKKVLTTGGNGIRIARIWILEQ